MTPAVKLSGRAERRKRLYGVNLVNVRNPVREITNNLEMSLIGVVPIC
jgi:hypothetical protein